MNTECHHSLSYPVRKQLFYRQLWSVSSAVYIFPGVIVCSYEVNRVAMLWKGCFHIGGSEQCKRLATHIHSSPLVT